MGKVVDITDKLTFDENPTIKIKDVELEINADAKTVLQIMGVFSEETETKAALKSARLIFGDEGLEKLENMKLSTKDFMKVIEMSMDIAMGKDTGEEQGEEETRTTT